VTEDDDQWETVQVGRSRAKPEKEDKKGNGGSGSNNASGSNSRNWRDRPNRENKDKDEDDKRHGGSSKGNKKGSSSVPPSASSERKPLPTPTPAPVSNPPKAAWGASTPTPQQQATIPAAHTTPGSTTSTSIQTPRTINNIPGRSRTEPPSPSLNGTTVTAESASLASPNLTGDISGSSTAATSVVGKGEVEEDWSRVEEVAVPAPVRQPAPPPAVNPWEARKKGMITSSGANGPTGNGTANPTPAQSQIPKETRRDDHSGAINSVTPNESSMINQTVEDKGGKKKKKASSEPSSAILSLGGKEMWPDVNQAAEVIKKDEEKKVTKEKKESEEGSIAETSNAGPSKSSGHAGYGADHRCRENEMGQYTCSGITSRSRRSGTISSCSTKSS